MFTVESISEGFYKEKGSKFIAFLYPVNNVEQISIIVQHLWQQHRDARHVCYAYKIDKLTRENDDGEPAHTAGAPIMRQIQSANLNRVALFVVRYFGGTKLGVSGLIQAYGTSAQESITNANLVPYIEKIKVRIIFDYPVTNSIKYLISKYEIQVDNSEFTTQCIFSLIIPLQNYDFLKDEFLNYAGSWDLIPTD